MSRTFLCPDLPERGPAVLPAGESRHLATVLRAREGDAIAVSDGRGRLGTARVARIEHGVAHLEILAVARAAPRPAGRGAVATAIPKGSRADWLIEKCVEAGVDAIFPVLTRRGVATAEGASRRERWGRLASEAAKQCGRAGLPEILEPRPLAEVLELTSSWPVRLVADPEGGPPGSVPHGDAVVFVGPEGGFAPDELTAMAAFPRLRLAPDILKVETAAVLAAAALALRGAP